MYFRSKNVLFILTFGTFRFADYTYKLIGAEKKELFIVPNARHTDFYDNQAGIIPFDKLETFFSENLQ